MIPYGRQLISQEDIDAVVTVLESDWLTTGPKVDEFESALSCFTGAEFSVTFSSGTAALHAAMAILDIAPGDEVIVPPLTFVATANCILYQGGTPVFSDVSPDTLLLDPAEVRKNITPNTRAIIAMDYAGQPCDYVELRKICDEYGLMLVADACHSLGAENMGEKVGCLADITALSFHPVKHICTGEGGALLLRNEEHALKANKFRNHGINIDHHERKQSGTWKYDMENLGFNYRLTDFQSALGISQLKRLPQWLKNRSEIAAEYDASIDGIEGINPLAKREGARHANHLYVIRNNQKLTGIGRDALYTKLNEKGIGVNVHYMPVFNHSYYKKRFPDAGVNCPVATKAADEILSLPMFSSLTNEQTNTVICELISAVNNQE